MRSGIDAVGREAYLYQIVVPDFQVLGGRHTHGGLGGQLHNAVVRDSNAQFVLGAQHAERLDAPDFAALDFELLVAAIGIKDSAHGGAQHLEPGAAVGSAADDLQRLGSPDVDRRDVQVVGIGMVDAGEHFAHDDAPEPAPHGLDLLETLDLEADVGQYGGDLLGRQIDVDITPEPVIGNIHIANL